MQVSISTGLMYKRSAEEILDLIAESGCKNIELCLNQSFMDLSKETIKSMTDKRGLSVKSIHLPFAFLMAERGEIEREWVRKGVQLAHYIDADVIVTHAPYKDENGQRVSNEDDHKLMLKDYHHMKKPIVTTENLSNIGFGFIGEKRGELLKFLKESNLSMTYDVTHAADHNQDILDDFEAFEDHIVNIHLSDYLDGNEHKILGQGNLPIVEFIKQLKEKGYKGLLTIELDFEAKERNKIDTRQDAINGLKKCLEVVEMSYDK